MGYVAEAQRRARRRKSLWNLLLLFVVVFALAVFFAAAALLAQALHGWAYPGESFRGASGFGPGFSAIASFLGAVPLALLTANALIWKAAPARRALEAEAKPHPSTTYRSSQTTLAKVAALSVPLALALAALGALLPW